VKLAQELAREGWKPYALKQHNGAEVEVISYPWPSNGKVFVNVRTVPGDPTSIVTIELE
jgi:hypothetical protein